MLLMNNINHAITVDINSIFFNLWYQFPLKFEIRIQNNRKQPSHEYELNATDACRLDFCYPLSPPTFMNVIFL